MELLALLPERGVLKIGCPAVRPAAAGFTAGYRLCKPPACGRVASSIQYRRHFEEPAARLPYLFVERAPVS